MQNSPGTFKDFTPQNLEQIGVVLHEMQAGLPGLKGRDWGDVSDCLAGMWINGTIM